MKETFAPLLEDAKTPDKHYIPAHYPDTFPDLTPTGVYGRDDAETALQSVEGCWRKLKVCFLALILEGIRLLCYAKR